MTRHPPPPPYLNPLPLLSRSERNIMLEDAYEAYAQLFQAIRIARGGSDAHATALGGVSDRTTGTVMMCTTTTITGTLDELAELYTARDSHFVLDFAESTRLYELETPSPDHPLRCVGLRYSRLASISSLVNDRDFVYLEVMDEFVDKKTGFRGWARCTKSIKHRACPPSQYASGPIRAELFAMGLVVRETAKFGVLELITLLHVDLKKRIPSWITRTVLKTRNKNALALSHVLKIKRRVRNGDSSDGGSQRGLHDGTGPMHGHSHTTASDDGSKLGKDKPDRRACKGCMDHVSRWTRSYKCRKCHELICKSCATMTYIDTDTKQLRNRMCAECSFATADESCYQYNISVDLEGEALHSHKSVPTPQRHEGQHNGAGEPRSDRGWGRRDTRKRTKDKHHPSRGEGGEGGRGGGRERTYSQLSVEEQPYPSFASVVTPSRDGDDSGATEDLSSTMRRLQQLNAAKLPEDSITDEDYVYEDTSRRGRQPSRREDENAANEDSGRGYPSSRRQRVDSNVSLTESSRDAPVLHRQLSGGISNHRTRRPRALYRKQSSAELSPTAQSGGHESSRLDPNPPRKAADLLATESPTRPVTQKIRLCSPVIKAETAPPTPVSVPPTTPGMIDLSYLQSFRSAAPSHQPHTKPTRV